MSEQESNHGIVLTTLNARWAHAAFGLRCLMANLGPLRHKTQILEFDVSQRTGDIVERVLAVRPRIVGVGVYVWNVEAATAVVAELKAIRPEIVVVLGGPEVSYEAEGQEVVGLADYVVTREAEVDFGELCGQILAGERGGQKIIEGRRPDLQTMALPYDLYTEEDIAHRVIYVEASRGCPFECEFCLSSLDEAVRPVPLERFLPAMQSLIDRGARQFKFVDRTFNVNASHARAILEFFLERYRPGWFLHFEMIPDHLPEDLRRLIAKFPAGAIQLEVGVQTYNEEVARRIGRRQDNEKVEENLRFLREETGVHVHADLIAGLPGEDLQSFAAGFDRLAGLRPQEIQVGILKRLRGAPIARHTQEWQMVYSLRSPYEVLQTGAIDFSTMQRIKRMARYWDLIANSGNFRETTPLICEGGSAFGEFLKLADWLWERTGSSHGIARSRLATLMGEYLVTVRGVAKERVRGLLLKDERRGSHGHGPVRQRRHGGDGNESACERNMR